MNKRYKKLPIEVWIHVRYLHQDKGEKIVDICKRYSHLPKTSIFRHCKLPLGKAKKMGDTVIVADPRNYNRVTKELWSMPKRIAMVIKNKGMRTNY